MKHIAVFASGSGSNAENLIRYFANSSSCRVTLVLCNNPLAGVIDRAARLGVDCHVFTKKDFYETDIVLNRLKQDNTDLIVLAGFLWLVPENLIQAYSGKIINIHPALLPGAGGKGMYGSRVHEAVIQNKEKKSGITIHYVNEKFDEGEIIFKAEIPVEPGDSPETLAGKIHHLEYKYYPEVIEKLLDGK